MGKNDLAFRAGLFSIVFILLTVPCFARQKGLPPLGRDFVIAFAGIALFLIIISVKTRGFLWPVMAVLRSQARWLSLAHIILFLSCFLFCADLVIEKCHSSTGQIQASSAVRADEKSGSGSSSTIYSAVITQLELFAGKSALPLFIFGALLLLPGIYAQRKIDPEKYCERAFRNSMRAMAFGLLLIPTYIILYYFSLALTGFIRD